MIRSIGYHYQGESNSIPKLFVLNLIKTTITFPKPCPGTASYSSMWNRQSSPSKMFHYKPLDREGIAHVFLHTTTHQITNIGRKYWSRWRYYGYLMNNRCRRTLILFQQRLSTTFLFFHVCKTGMNIQCLAFLMDRGIYNLFHNLKTAYRLFPPLLASRSR